MPENKKSCLHGRRIRRRLSPMERLGLAYCRLEGLAWDDYIGPKPKGFDEAPNNVKHFIVQRHIHRIEAMLGETYLDRCRWVYDRQLSEESWLKLRNNLWNKGLLVTSHSRNDVLNDSSSSFDFPLS